MGAEIDRMQMIKKYVVKNFEQFFVLLILLSVASITYFLPYKLAFLNFFYIPILLAASYLGTRQAVLGAILSLILVCIYAVLYPAQFSSAASYFDLAAQIMAWGCFLILSGGVVGYLNQQLKTKIYQATKLDNELTSQKDLLAKTTRELMEHTENLERKVAERTDSLEKSKRAVEEHKDKVEEALYSTMDAAVVKLMIEKRLRTEKRRISILFCDLKGFTKYSENQRPEAVVTDLNKYLAEMETTLFEYRAHIDKYMGDGIMAEFGAPVDYERHALLATSAGLKIQERVKAGEYPWAMRVGIATGQPIIGLIGHQRQSYTALGDVVNLASRIEELCEPGAVTIDEETANDIREFFHLQRKTVLPMDEDAPVGVAERLADVVAQLDEQPESLSLLKTAGNLYLEAKQVSEAVAYFKRAVAVDPDDAEAKLAYADASLKAEESGEVKIRGRAQMIHLYEVTGLKDPLLDRNRIPEDVYAKYEALVSRIVSYPQDIMLPVECLDGSVGHSKLVGFLAGALAHHLDLPDKIRHDIVEAGYLANIGKTIVPHHVLNRKGSLTKDEAMDITAIYREAVRKLKTMGYSSNSLFEIIRGQQENYDGSGGPAGLAGRDIPVGARILKVVDAYSALTSWRPYRDRWDPRAAYHEIAKSARNGKFDPDITCCLGEVLGFEEIRSIDLRAAS